ncbi:UNVERIFIED_CONTAM: hypothetical protein K2H54_056201, partial [Gekko kuhli]
CKDGTDVDQWRHIQDCILPSQPSSFPVLHLWTSPSLCGYGHPDAGLLLQLLPPEANFTPNTPSQYKGTLKHKVEASISHLCLEPALQFQLLNTAFLIGWKKKKNIITWEEYHT